MWITVWLNSNFSKKVSVIVQLLKKHSSEKNEKKRKNRKERKDNLQCSETNVKLLHGVISIEKAFFFTSFFWDLWFFWAPHPHSHHRYLRDYCDATDAIVRVNMGLGTNTSYSFWMCY